MQNNFFLAYITTCNTHTSSPLWYEFKTSGREFSEKKYKSTQRLPSQSMAVPKFAKSPFLQHSAHQECVAAALVEVKCVKISNAPYFQVSLRVWIMENESEKQQKRVFIMNASARACRVLNPAPFRARCCEADARAKIPSVLDTRIFFTHSAPKAAKIILYASFFTERETRVYKRGKAAWFALYRGGTRAQWRSNYRTNIWHVASRTTRSARERENRSRLEIEEIGAFAVCEMQIFSVFLIWGGTAATRL